MSTIFDFDSVSFSSSEIGFPEDSGIYPSFLRGWKVDGSGTDMRVSLFLGMEKNISTPVNIHMGKVAWLMASFLRANGIAVTGQLDIAKELENIQKTPQYFRVNYTAGTRSDDDSWVNWPRYKFYRATDADCGVASTLRNGENGSADSAGADEDIPF